MCFVLLLEIYQTCSNICVSKLSPNIPYNAVNYKQWNCIEIRIIIIYNVYYKIEVTSKTKKEFTQNSSQSYFQVEYLYVIYGFYFISLWFPYPKIKFHDMQELLMEGEIFIKI